MIFAGGAPGVGALGQFDERLAVHRLVGHIDIHTPGRHVQELGVIDFNRIRPEHIHQHITCPRDRYYITLLQHGVRGCLLDRPVSADALNEDARIGYKRLGLYGSETNYPSRLPSHETRVFPTYARLNPGRPSLSCRLASPHSPCRRPGRLMRSSHGPRSAITSADPTVPNM